MSDETTGPNLLPGEPGYAKDQSLQAHHEASHDHEGEDGSCWCCCLRCTEDPALHGRIAAYWLQLQQAAPDED